MAEWSGVAGREVLIAGATSGIGLADAKELARRGAKLAIVARSEAEGCETVERIQAVGGTDARAEVLIADLASQASIRSLAAETLDRYPGIDVLINNAGGCSGPAQMPLYRSVRPTYCLLFAVSRVAPMLTSAAFRAKQHALTHSARARPSTSPNEVRVGGDSCRLGW